MLFSNSEQMEQPIKKKLKNGIILLGLNLDFFPYKQLLENIKPRLLYCSYLTSWTR